MNIRVLLVTASLLASTQTSADVVIDRTRVVYPQQAREMTLSLTNEALEPRLVQVWIDAGDAMARPESSDVPFLVVQPLLRVEAGAGQALRLIHTSEPDQPRLTTESLYWLNVLVIRPAPPAGESNHLSLAFRTRIKLFLRPESLPGAVEDAPAALRWTWQGRSLHVSNPGDYFITLSSVVLNREGRTWRNDLPPMLTPRSSATLTLTAAGPAGQVEDQFTTLDDNGASLSHALAPVETEAE
ncbi:fimbrial biogenesis chaperone [Pseudomonas sp. Z18(2022)]|uniref:fimbrial biogenesis chaperone n=1 Tax=Pseudomonas sp. Z18(2022) TaxID=2983410 RepID=UPI002E809E26|nr:molecular chaperone [Pseudomonas sp. Z18(2022)]